MNRFMMLSGLPSVRRMTGVLLVAGLAACSKNEILTPDTPDVITPEQLATPEGIAAVHAGAVSDLVVAATGLNGVVIYSGLFTDELMHASTPPAVREWDLRNVVATNSVLTAGNTVANPAGGPFLGIQRARSALEIAAARLPAGDVRTGEVYALAGLSYILIGELWCSGTPISEREPEVALGPPLSTTELFDRSLERLTSAAANSAGDARITQLIAVLRGRALLNLGQYAAAATAVSAVATDYSYDFLHGAPPARQGNQVHLTTETDVYSVPDREGVNGLNFASAADPRVPVEATGASRNDGVTPMSVALKYPAIGSPVPMVTGIEARMIEAEAALQAGDPDGWLAKLNLARATVTGLAPLTDPGTPAARVDLLFRERAFWFYLTAHRLGDLRRLVRQYGRAIESVYPSGAYHKQGLTRGTQATLRVPQVEENNPNYDPAACLVTQA
ncbi:MAG: RagB/SusD family nutrient uptake outer membrane protein [Gemmatimonadales bacterium]